MLKSKYLLFAGAVAALGACERVAPPAPAAPPAKTVYALSEGIPVWKAGKNEIATEPVRRLRYGEPILAECDAKFCRFSENGQSLEVAQHTVRELPLPARVQYAIKTAKVYGNPATGPVLKRKLRAGEQVEIRQYKAEGIQPRVEIGEGEWVDLDILKEKPESRKERREREKAEAVEAAAERERARAEARIRTENRRQYAELLRERFLDRALDIKVKVSGSQADQLALEYVLFSDVWSHRFSKDGEIDTWCQMGFKTIRMSNKYDWAVRFTCE